MWNFFGTFQGGGAWPKWPKGKYAAARQRTASVGDVARVHACIGKGALTV